MKKERNATKAGFFILISAILIVAVIIAIKGLGQFAEPQQSFVANFKLSDDLSGLRPGDDVRVGGVKVGTISAIEPANLNTPDPDMQVTFAVPTRFKLHSDAMVGVQSTLTGSACLNIASLGTPSAPLADHHLNGNPDPKTVALASLASAGADISFITHQVRNETLPRVDRAVDSAHHLIQHVDEKIDPSVERYNVVTEKAGGALDSIHEMLGPSVKDFHGIVSDFHEISGDLKGRLPELLNKADSAIDQTRSALQSVQDTVDNTQQISSAVRSVIVDNKGKLDGIINSVQSTGENLKDASIEIRHSPWRLLYKPSPGEMSNLNLFDATREFAEGANELNDAAQALKDVANDKHADPQKVQEMVNRLEHTFAKFHNVEQKLWTDVKQ